jgi:putative ABC transport system substrate-binding protein
MKKVFVMALALAMALGSSVFAGGSSQSGNSAVKKIGFIQLSDNVTFKDMRDGFNAELAAKGFGPDKVQVVYKEAQGDTGTLNTICQEFANGPYDLVVTLATPATQAFLNLQSGKPQVFIAVADPVGSKIVPSIEHPSAATGTSNYIPIDALFELADKLTPGIKNYGFIYNFGESNAVATVKRAVAYLKDRGLQSVESTVSNAGDVQQAAVDLAGKCDAIFIPNDSMVVSAMPQVIAIAEEARDGKGIPVYGTDMVHVKYGALATVGIDDREIGAESADMVIALFRGKKIADLPVFTFKKLETLVNKKTAERLGVKIPSDLSNVQFIE